MEPTYDLIASIDRAKMKQARGMSDADRIFAGARIFNRVCRVARDGIRSQFPDADEAAVERELDRRLAIARRVEQQP